MVRGADISIIIISSIGEKRRGGRVILREKSLGSGGVNSVSAYGGRISVMSIS
jgi:hypothetical protein